MRESAHRTDWNLEVNAVEERKKKEKNGEWNEAFVPLFVRAFRSLLSLHFLTHYVHSLLLITRTQRTV